MLNYLPSDQNGSHRHGGGYRVANDVGGSGVYFLVEVVELGVLG